MSLVEFNEWYGDKGEKLHIYRDEKWIAKHGFEAGQQSQQGEVDKLQTKIDELNERNSEEKRILHNVIKMNQAKIDELQKLRSLDEMAINQLAQANQVWQIKCDELQKRIDDASNKIDFWVGGKNGDAIHVAKSIGNILKGNKDEN